MIDIIKHDEVIDALNLIKSVFDEFIAEEYSSEGIDNFYNCITFQSVSERVKSGSMINVFKSGNEITGYMELAGINHIYLLFVKKDCQKQGIARQLIDSLIVYMQSNYPGVKEITVNSTFNALGFYEKTGFKKIADFQFKNGITSYPMKLVIS
jgi:ribosomal protein S18 acetylase RimI-like enzyme